MCLGGTYKSFVGSTACQGCPARSISSTQSIIDTACVCNAGYTGADGGACSPCNNDHYKPAIGTLQPIGGPPEDALQPIGGPPEDALQPIGGPPADALQPIGAP